MTSVIVAVIDGLRLDVAQERFVNFNRYIEMNEASLHRMVCGNPSISRPMYASILTGVPTTIHHIVSNDINEKLTVPDLFTLVSDSGRTTGAVAHSYFHELVYGGYDPALHSSYDGQERPIHHGRFYGGPPYHDEKEINRTSNLITQHKPDFVLCHFSDLDYFGDNFEGFGSLSKEYLDHAAKLDEMLITQVLRWRDEGYVVFVTSDHGMKAEMGVGSHGGTTPEELQIPFYVFAPESKGPKPGTYTKESDQMLDICQIAPTVLTVLGVSVPGTMKHKPLYQEGVWSIP